MFKNCHKGYFYISHKLSFIHLLPSTLQKGWGFFADQVLEICSISLFAFFPLKVVSQVGKFVSGIRGCQIDDLVLEEGFFMLNV